MSSSKQSLWKQYMMAILANLGLISTGTMFAYTAHVSPLVMAKDGPLQITEMQNSWFSSSLNIGAMIGGLTAHIILQKYGRRGTMLIMCWPLLIGWIILAAAQNFSMLLFGRLVHGLCMGIFTAAVPPYVGEISATSIRGRLGSLVGLFIAIGILYIYIVGALVKDFRWISALNIPIPILYFVLMFFFAYESPVYLLEKGRVDHAKKVLQVLNGPDYDISEDFESLLNMGKEYGRSDSDGMLHQISKFKAREVYTPLVIISFIQLFQQFCGINGIIFNLSVIFESTGTNFSNDVSMIVVGCVQVLSAVLGASLMDFAGRKLLLIISYAGMAVSMALLGTYFYLIGLTDQWQDWTSDTLWWLPLLSLALFMVSFCIGAASIGFVFVGEFFTPDVRMICSGFVSFVTWGASFVVTLTYSQTKQSLGSAGVLWMYAVFAVIATAFTAIAVPETKGRSLETITNYFKTGKFSDNSVLYKSQLTSCNEGEVKTKM